MADTNPKCPVCGSPLLADQETCPSCGRDTADLETRISTSPSRSQHPSTLGDFSIVREIGRGGMGTVYEARQESMHRTVALKILDAGAIPSRKTEARFEREAWIGGRLSHPNIVKVYAQGVEGRSHYIAMELAGGESLHSEIREARARRAEVASDSSWCAEHIRRMVSLFADVADAFYYVHQRGVVHRDIKPSNLVLSEDGSRLMITDFGLARDAESASLTRPGDFMGTVRYMSPEQLLAQRMKVDHRSDIWSLGVSLYEAVTLDLPYSGDSEEAFIGAISTKDPIPARARESAVPRDVETILMKCLERDPERRYASAAELEQDLRRFLADEPVLARRPGALLKAARFAKRRRALVAVVVSAVAVVSVLGVHWLRQNREREAYTATLARLEERGRISKNDARLAIGRQLEPDEQELREAFLSGNLPDDLRLRFARYLLEPDILIDPYVDRTHFTDWKDPRDALYAEIIEWHWDWGLVAIVQTTVVLDGDEIWKRPLAPWGLVLLLEGDEVGSLSVGQHKLGIELVAWFFDLDDVMTPDDERPSPDEPLGGWTWGEFWGEAADTAVVYGPDEEPWQQFWPEYRDSVQHMPVGPIRYPATRFTITDGPLIGYPRAIHSPAIDQVMKEVIHLEYCRLALWEREDGHKGYHLEIGLKTSKPLPAPLISVVEVETPWGQAYCGRIGDPDEPERDREPGASVFIKRGEMTFQEPWVPLLWSEWRQDPRYPPIPRNRTQLEAVGSVPVRVTLRPPVGDEAEGIESYWGGTLVFDTTAEMVMGE